MFDEMVRTVSVNHETSTASAGGGRGRGSA